MHLEISPRVIECAYNTLLAKKYKHTKIINVVTDSKWHNARLIFNTNISISWYMLLFLLIKMRSLHTYAN